MGRTVFADEVLLDYLISLGKPSGYTIGLILGQSASQKDFVIYLARTPPPAKRDVIEETPIESISSSNSSSSLASIPQDFVDNTYYVPAVEDIQEGWVADHAKHVTRMLPGGTVVLGIFTVGPSEILNQTTSVKKLRSVLAAIHKNLDTNRYLHGNSSQEKLILSLNSITQKYVCKSLETSAAVAANGSSSSVGILKPADWKFQNKVSFTRWYQLEALVDLDQLYPIPKNVKPQTLKKQLQDILRTTSDKVDSALVIIEGELRSPDDTIVSVIGKQQEQQQQKHKQKNNEDSSSNSSKDRIDDTELDERILQAGLFIPCERNVSQEINAISCSSSIRLVGQLVSRSFVHQRATIEEATKAIKQDIMRSLASRLEMHWDSLIEEEDDGSTEETVTLHEPPRRVLVQLPQNSVSLSDYLFPGEGAQEALLSLRELLDLQQVQEGSIQKDLELQADPAVFDFQNANTAASATGTNASNKDHMGSRRRTMVFVTGLSIAFFILLIAILLHYILKRHSEFEDF